MSSVRKALAAVVGVVVQAVAAGVVPVDWRPWTAILIAVATAAGVYLVPPNEPTPAPYNPAFPPNDSGFIQ